MPNVQQLDVLNAVTVESGAVQLGTEAPGLYLTGEDARLVALDIAVLVALVTLRRGANWNAVKTALHHLEKLHDRIRDDVALPTAGPAP